MNDGRRSFICGAAVLGAGLLTSKAARGAQHEHEQHPKPSPQEKPVRGATSPDYSAAAPEGFLPVETPDVPKLAWTMDNGVKVFHLVAEPVRREFLPASPYGDAKVVDCWGYNGAMPGPTIEVVEGDRVRIILDNHLPEPTSIHWHGFEIPVEMDGMPGISQEPIPPGGRFVYEFTLHQHGTFFYHSHMAMPQMLGMMGMFIMHPKEPHKPRVDCDFGLILQEWAILPNNSVPNTMAMEFNWLTINGKAGPAATPLLVRLGERVRIRLVNLGMDHHPIHIHGNTFYVTGTEAGRIPEAAWTPGNTVLVGVAQARDIEFDARNPGDWMLHCHMPHHMMNQMASLVGPMTHSGHDMPAGRGMEEGMGIVRRGNALAGELGASLGRGMGLAAERERQTTNLPLQQQEHAEHAMPGIEGQQREQVPGYPQEMFMVMDQAVAKPENYGLRPGWTADMMGMMTLVRVLPPELYEKIMALKVKAQKELPASQPKPRQHMHNS